MFSGVTRSLLDDCIGFKSEFIQPIGLRQPVISVKKNKSGAFPHLHTDIHSKWITDRTQSARAKELSEENTGLTLCDLGLGHGFSDDSKTTRNKQTKHWTLSQLKTFVLQKMSSRKWKEPSEWEKMLASHKFNKVLVSKIYKEALLLNNKKTNSPIKNGQRN